MCGKNLKSVKAIKKKSIKLIMFMLKLLNRGINKLNYWDNKSGEKLEKMKHLLLINKLFRIRMIELFSYYKGGNKVKLKKLMKIELHKNF